MAESMLGGFGFYPTLLRLAKGDLSKMDEIRNTWSVGKVYYLLAYERQENRLKEALQEVAKERSVNGLR